MQAGGLDPGQQLAGALVGRMQETGLATGTTARGLPALASGWLQGA